MAMTTCPTCNQPLARSTVLVPGLVVLACRQCRRMTVEIEGMNMEWIPGGPGVVDRLKAMAKDAIEMKAAIETPINDPRWTEMMI